MLCMSMLLYLSHLVARPGFVRVLLSDDGILASPEGVVATSSIAGRYVCMANNRFGSTEVNINIDVQGEVCMCCYNSEYKPLIP